MGEQDGCGVAGHPECHLHSVGHSCQGSVPLSFVSAQKLYTGGCVKRSATADCPGLAHSTYLVTGFPENLSEN